jgi:hypothetical protein
LKIHCLQTYSNSCRIERLMHGVTSLRMSQLECQMWRSGQAMSGSA